MVQEFRKASAGNSNESNDAAARFSLRSQYVMGLVKTYVDECDSGRVSFVRSIRWDMLKSHVKKVAQIDFGIPGCADDHAKIWESTWVRLLSTIEPAMMSKFAAERVTATRQRGSSASCSAAPIAPVAAVSEEVDQVPALMSINDLYFMSSTQTLTKVQYVKSLIQAAVWSTYHDTVPIWGPKVMVRTQGSRSSIVAASGGIAHTTCFPFAGEVTVVESKREVFLLGEFEGVKFYLQSGPHHAMDSECMSVPWATKAVKGGKLSRTNCALVNFPLDVPEVDEDVKFVLPWLQTTEDIMEEVELVRPSSTDEFSSGVGRKRAASPAGDTPPPSTSSSKKLKHLAQ